METAAMREPAAVRLGRNVHLNVQIAAARAREAADTICGRAGITQQQYTALWNLCLGERSADGLPIGELADGLINRAADTTRLVDRMVAAGLVERLPHPTDRRSVLVRATESGRQAFAAVTPELQAYHRHEWSPLDADEVRTLDRLLQRALWDGPSD